MDFAAEAGYASAPCPGASSGLRAPVAQLDRVLPSEGRGRTFESSRARQTIQWVRSLRTWPVLFCAHPVAEPRPRCDRAGVSSARPRSRSSVAFRDRAVGARASCASSSSICSPRGGQVPVSNCRECPRRMAASPTALRSVCASKPPGHAPESARRVILVLDRASPATPMIAVFVTIHFSETLRR